ncbi:hypothetical protein BH23ACT11_BH23ACT11_26440 [soil metagenome]
MVRVVAVEEPFARVIRLEVNAHVPPMRVDEHGVFERTAVRAVSYLKEVAVKVHGMQHHAPIAKIKAHPLALAYLKWFCIWVELSVNGPDIVPVAACKRKV